MISACLWRARGRYLCYRVGRFLTGCVISDECTALLLMFVSNTALTPTLLFWLYDMGMFPKLHSVWQYPLLEISTSRYAGAFSSRTESVFFLYFFKKVFVHSIFVS